MHIGSRKHNPTPATRNLTKALKETLAMKTKPTTVVTLPAPALTPKEAVAAIKKIRVKKEEVVIDDTAREVRAAKPVLKAVSKALDAAEGKAPVDDGMLSVSDVAREMSIDPKVARAKLRRMGQAATEGRWAKVKRDSREHKALIAALTSPPPKAEEKE